MHRRALRWVFPFVAVVSVLLGLLIAVVWWCSRTPGSCTYAWARNERWGVATMTEGGVCQLKVIHYLSPGGVREPPGWSHDGRWREASLLVEFTYYFSANEDPVLEGGDV